MSDGILNAALEYAELGFSVVPVHPAKKYPCVNWKEFQDRQASADELEAWWKKFPDADVGFITGKASNVAVIDCDSPEAVKWVEERYPTSVSQKTTQGKHFFYRPNSALIKTVAGVRPDIDIKGDGGFSVLAPSSHKSGIPYKLEYVEGYQDWDDLAPFPYDIFQEVTGVEREPVNHFEPILEGQRDSTLTQLAGGYFKKGHDLGQVKALIRHDNLRCQPLLAEKDVVKICESIGRAESISNPVIEVMTPEDIKAEDITLKIPDNLTRPGGLIDIGVDGMLEAGLQDIPQFYLPVILSHIANAIAGKIVVHAIWPSLYSVKVGGPSSGKSLADNTLKRIIRPRDDFKDFYGPSRVTSGAGILTGLQKTPQQLLIMDEIKSLFQRYGESDKNGDSKREELLGVYSEAGDVIDKPYGSSRNNILIYQPCLNLLGNTTLTVFDSIKRDDFASGLIPRIEFWCFDGRTETKGFVGETSNPGLDAFCDGLSKIYNSKPDTTVQGNLSFLVPFNGFARNGSDKILDQILQEKTDYQNNPENTPENVSLVARGVETAAKYAMVHHAATNKNLRSPVQPESFIYGKRLASILIDWKIRILENKITGSELERRCEAFKEAITRSIISGRPKPTFKYMMTRKKELRGWSKLESRDVIEMLVTRKEILVDDVNANTRYLLVKQK